MTYHYDWRNETLILTMSLLVLKAVVILEFNPQRDSSPVTLYDVKSMCK